jgi:hypothetical protein
MLYTYGDSFTYGWTLPDTSKSWGSVLSKKLNTGFKNLAYPGGSNWKMCRELQNTNLKKNDIVVIGWTISNRFEFGKLDKSVPNDQYPFANPKNDIQPFFEQIIGRASDDSVRTFANIAYGSLYNEEWFDDMFKTMYWASRSYLDRKKVKWLMFDTWCPAIDTFWFSDMDHKNYVYRGKNNMDNFVRRNFDNVHHESGYWNEDGHQKVADLLHSCL